MIEHDGGKQFTASEMPPWITQTAKLQSIAKAGLGVAGVVDGSVVVRIQAMMAKEPGSSSFCVIHSLLAARSLWAGMRTKSKWSPGPGVKILGVALTVANGWVVSAAGSNTGICPDCGCRSRSRHGWSGRNLRDLPVQGKPVTVKLLLSRWQCANRECARRTFTDRLPMIAAPYTRRTRRVGEIVGLLGHSAGGRPGERLMQRLGMPVSAAVADARV